MIWHWINGWVAGKHAQAGDNIPSLGEKHSIKRLIIERFQVKVGNDDRETLKEMIVEEIDNLNEYRI